MYHELKPVRKKLTGEGLEIKDYRLFVENKKDEDLDRC